MSMAGVQGKAAGSGGDCGLRGVLCAPSREHRLSLNPAAVARRDRELGVVQGTDFSREGNFFFFNEKTPLLILAMH